MAFTAQVEFPVSCSSVRAQGGSWLTSTCRRRASLGLCLPIQVCPWPAAGSPTVASGSCLSLGIGIAQGGQEPQRTDARTWPQITPTLALCPLGLPTLQGQPPCPQMPLHSGGNSWSALRPALSMLKGSSFTNLLSTNLGGFGNCLLPVFCAPFPSPAPGDLPPDPASRKGGSKWNMV